MTLTSEQFRAFLGLLGGGIFAAVSSIIWIYATFALASDLEDHEHDAEQRMLDTEVRIAKGQYYDRVDDLEETQAEGRDTDDLEAEIDDLLSFICENEPTWPKCK